jgi:hypothetical protein
MVDAPVSASSIWLDCVNEGMECECETPPAPRYWCIRYKYTICCDAKWRWWNDGFGVCGVLLFTHLLLNDFGRILCVLCGVLLLERASKLESCTVVKHAKMQKLQSSVLKCRGFCFFSFFRRQLTAEETSVVNCSRLKISVVNCRGSIFVFYMCATAFCNVSTTIF